MRMTNTTALVGGLLLGLGVVACSTTPGKEVDETGDPGTVDEGVSGTPGAVELDHTVIDFGVLPVGMSASEVVTISNDGGSTLTIDALGLGGSGQFSLTSPEDVEGLELPAGSSVELTVTYTADDETADTDTLDIETSEGTSTVTLQGNGTLAVPVADIVCPTESDVPTAAPLDGRGSTPGAGASIEDYMWTIVAAPPSSRTADVTDPGRAQTSVFVDVPGTWTMSLEVENDLGQTSAPATCTFDAASMAELHVTLTWDTGNSDLDLHLTRDDALPFELPGDCTYCNPSPDWGSTGSDGNPTLALDNRVGYGPEIIRIGVVEDDSYDVWVHYFDDKGGGLTEATIQVWSGSDLLWEGTGELSGRDMWNVGTYSVADGSFTASAAIPTRWEGNNSCYEPEEPE